MGAVSLPDDQKSLVILVDNEHWCQLFYRSPPPPRLLSFALCPEGFRKHERPRVTRPVAFVRHRHGLALPVASGVALRRGCSGQGPQYQNQPYQRKPRRHLEHAATIRARPEAVKRRSGDRAPTARKR